MNAKGHIPRPRRGSRRALRRAAGERLHFVGQRRDSPYAGHVLRGARVVIARFDLQRAARGRTRRSRAPSRPPSERAPSCRETRSLLWRLVSRSASVHCSHVTVAAAEARAREQGRLHTRRSRARPARRATWRSRRSSRRRSRRRARRKAPSRPRTPRHPPPTYAQLRVTPATQWKITAITPLAPSFHPHPTHKIRF